MKCSAWEPRIRARTADPKRGVSARSHTAFGRGKKSVETSPIRARMRLSCFRRKTGSARRPHSGSFLPGVEAFFHEVERKALAFARPAGKWSAIRLGVLGGSIVLIAVIVYLIPVIGHLRVGRTITPRRPPVTAEVTQYVHIRPDPDDSTVTRDGKPVTDGAAAVGATVEVSHLGYITKRAQVQQESRWEDHARTRADAHVNSDFGEKWNG